MQSRGVVSPKPPCHAPCVQVLRVVGRAPSLAHLELHACSSSVPPWPGAAADNDTAGPLPPAAALNNPNNAGANAAAVAAAQQVSCSLVRRVVCRLIGLGAGAGL